MGHAWVIIRVPASKRCLLVVGEEEIGEIYRKKAGKRVFHGNVIGSGGGTRIPATHDMLHTPHKRKRHTRTRPSTKPTPTSGPTPAVERLVTGCVGLF